MSGILVEVYEQGGTLLETHPVLDSYVVEVPVAQTVGVIEVGILGPQGPAGPEGPAGPGGGGDVYKAADQTFTGVNTFTGISVLQGPISPVVATDVAVRVRGLVGQSIDLQRWEDYGGTVLASINRFGEGLFNTQQGSGGVVVGRGNGAGFAGIRAGSDTGVLEIQGPQSGSTGALRLGNQTGGVTIFGPVLLDDQSGMHTTDSFVFYDGTYGTKAVLSPLHGFALGNLPTSTAPVLAVTAWAPSYPGVVVQGAVGQNAALQQWQNSGGTALASVNNAGELSTPAVYINEGGNGGVQWRRVSGVASWQWYSPDDPNLYLRDLINGRMSIQATPGLTVLSTPVMVGTGVASELPLYVRGASGQSGDLTQWQDYTGGVLAKVTAAGSVQSASFGAPQDNTTPAVFLTSTGQTALTIPGGYAGQKVEATSGLSVYPATNGLVPLSVTALAGQSVDLQTWSNSGGVPLARVTKDGYIYEGANRVYSAGNPPPGGSGGGSPFVAASDASTPLVVRAFSPTQSGNLQEWQRSDATKVAYIDQNGSFGALSTLNPFFVAQSAGAGDITWLGQVTNAGTWFSDTAANDGLIGHQGSGALRLGVGATIGGTLPAQVSITSTAVTSAVPLYATALYDNGSHVAIDSAVVHNTGSETVAGTKNFTAALTVSRPTNNDAIVLFNTTDSTSGRFRPKAGGGFDFVNNAATVAVLQLTDAGALVVASTIASGGNITENGNRVYSAGNAPPYPVTTVAGRTGAVVIAPADVSGVYYSGNANLASATPAAVASAGAVGAGTDYARGNHVHVGVTSVNGTSGVITGLAVDSTVVHNTGAETVAGVKTFSSIPVVPVLAWPVGSINATGTAGAGNYLRGDGTWSIPVTSVTGSTFISFTASTGSVTASLSATGTPGATNVLRGDNTWAAVPMSSQYTAKGTILVGSAASTPSAQAVGTDGQVLVARSAQTNGVGWENTNFAATGLGSTGNTVTETVIASFTIPAAYLLAGTVLRLACLGQASSTQTLTFKVHCGINGTTADALLQTFTTSAAGVANQHAMLDAFVHCLTAGSGGTIYAGGIATYGTAVLPPVTAAAISAAVDTTVQNKITVTMTNGSAGTSFTSRTATLNRVA